MRFWWVWAAVAVGMLACGGDEASVTPEDRLQGKWGVESSAYACVNMFSFDGDAFEMVEFCELEDGSYGAESYEGTYVLAGGVMTMTVARSSCSDAAPKQSAEVAFPGENLRLTTPAGVLILERASSMNTYTGSLAVEYGCFDDDGFFEPSPVREL